MKTPNRLSLFCLRRTGAAFLMLPSLLLADLPASVRLGAVAVRPVLPRVAGNACLDGFTDASLLERFQAALDASLQFRSDSSSTVLLRLRAAKVDDQCDVVLDFQDEQGQASARLTLLPGEKASEGDALGRLVGQMAQTFRKERGASLDLSTTPSGATVLLDGAEASVTPLRLDGLAPGPIPLTIALDGYVAISETLSTKVGQNLTVSRTLERSAEWRDSVRRAELAGRREQVWSAARDNPAKDLSDLYDRLALPVAPGSRAPVAILPFDVQGQADASYDPGRMAAEYGVARWSADPRFAVVERAGVSKLLAEQAFAQSGAASDSGAARMGLLVSAKYLVTGTVSVADGKQVFAARLVSVETGEILSAAVSEKPSEDVDALYREALGEKGQMSAAVYRSLVGPGWGQFYTGHPVQGTIALLGVAGAIGFATWAYMDYTDKDDDLQKFRKHDPATLREGESGEQWIERAEAARMDANDAGTMLGISFGVVGGVWLLNVVDAAILGHLESSRIKAKYFTYVPTPMVRPEGLTMAWRF